MIERMNDSSLFLVWLAARGSGSISSLEATMSNFFGRARGGLNHTETRATVVQLAQLGYIEIEWINRKWVSLPMEIHLLPGSMGLALLTGCRPLNFESLLEDAGIFAKRVRPTTPDAMNTHLPDTILLEFDTYTDLINAARQAKIPYKGASSKQLASSLSRVALNPETAPGPVATSIPLERFDELAFSFGASSIQGDGLYCQKSYGPKRYWIKHREEWHETSKAEGQWIALAMKSINALSWFSKSSGLSGELHVPFGLNFPGPQVEVLNSCSGTLPDRMRSKVLIFHNIPEFEAKLIIESLGQKFIFNYKK